MDMIAPPALAFTPVAPHDFDALADLRALAMRPSLERLGRYDPERSRSRLWAGFKPEHMRWICLDGARVGFYSLIQEDGAWKLDHLYLHPSMQSQGIGSAVMRHLIERTQGQSMRVTALRNSESNAFYRRHGFAQTGESEWDIEYKRSV